MSILSAYFFSSSVLLIESFHLSLHEVLGISLFLVLSLVSAQETITIFR